ncbi:MAG: hypothetical protein AABZ06_14195 [Bdellovibrionota bacterium]|mgnify:CR=1 FL=1
MKFKYLFIRALLAGVLLSSVVAFSASTHVFTQPSASGFSDGGADISGGGDSLELNQSNLEIIIPERLKTLIQFRLKNLDPNTADIWKQKYPPLIPIIDDPALLAFELASIQFSIRTSADRLSNEILEYQEGGTKKEFIFDIQKIINAGFRAWDLMALALALALNKMVEVKYGVNLDEEDLRVLKGSWNKTTNVSFENIDQLKAAIKNDLKKYLNFRIMNINQDNYSLLPKELKPIQSVLEKNRNIFLKDINMSKYRFSRDPIIVDGVRRDASTKHDLGSTIYFDVYRIFEKKLSLEDLVTLVFHEHARHFGIRDDHNQIGILVDRKYSVSMVQRNGAEYCDGQIEGRKYGIKVAKSLYAVEFLRHEPDYDEANPFARFPYSDEDIITPDLVIRNIGGLFQITKSSKPVHNYRERLGDFDSWTLYGFPTGLGGAFATYALFQNLPIDIPTGLIFTDYFNTYSLDEVFCR